MTKEQLIEALSEESQIPKKSIKVVLEELAILLANEVAINGRVVLPNICVLQKKNRAACSGRNPATGEPIKIPAKTVVVARPHSKMKQVFS